MVFMRLGGICDCNLQARYELVHCCRRLDKCDCWLVDKLKRNGDKKRLEPAVLGRFQSGVESAHQNIE
jgi:hypothetical protein